jgi:hypothetical protein
MKTNWTSVLRAGRTEKHVRVYRPTGSGPRSRTRPSQAVHKCLGRGDMLLLISRLK